jgi:hypothetical protein
LRAKSYSQLLTIGAESAAAAKGSFDDEFGPAAQEGRGRLHKILERQHYRLMWWRSANDEINWRRFFDINELAAIRVEDDEVFEAVHATIFRLYAEGLIDGLRIDHVDGLARPAEYCRKVRNRLLSLGGERPTNSPDGPPYLIVEKILGWDETLPAAWAADGTTGYDFMNEVSALQHDPRGERPLSELWHRGPFIHPERKSGTRGNAKVFPLDMARFGTRDVSCTKITLGDLVESVHGGIVLGRKTALQDLSAGKLFFASEIAIRPLTGRSILSSRNQLISLRFQFFKVRTWLGHGLFSLFWLVSL